MNAARMVREVMGLSRAPLLCGVSKKAWYYTPRPRNVSPDPEVQETVQKIGPAGPTYGTRRMAAQISREMNRPVNRKAVRRIFRRLGWSEPPCTKHEITRPTRSPRGRRPRTGSGSLACPMYGAERTGGILQRNGCLHQAVAGVRAVQPRHAAPCHNGSGQYSGSRRPLPWLCRLENVHLAGLHHHAAGPRVHHTVVHAGTGAIKRECELPAGEQLAVEGTTGIGYGVQDGVSIGPSHFRSRLQSYGGGIKAAFCLGAGRVERPFGYVHGWRRGSASHRRPSRWRAP